MFSTRRRLLRRFFFGQGFRPFAGMTLSRSDYDDHRVGAAAGAIGDTGIEHSAAGSTTPDAIGLDGVVPFAPLSLDEIDDDQECNRGKDDDCDDDVHGLPYLSGKHRRWKERASGVKPSVLPYLPSKLQTLASLSRLGPRIPVRLRPYPALAY